MSARDAKPATRSILWRVVLVVVGAGLVALAVSTVTVVRVVRDDKEASLVDDAIRRAETLHETLDHRVELARAELRGVSTAVSAGQFGQIASLLGRGTLAVRCTRGNDELLDAATSPETRDRLRASPAPDSGHVGLLGDAMLLIAERAAGVTSIALVDTSASWQVPEGWSVRLRDPAGSPPPLSPSSVVARRIRDRGEEAVRVLAPSRSGPIVDLRAPLGPVRAVALRMTRQVLWFSSVAILPLVLLAWFFSRRVAAPILALAKAVQETTRGPVRLPPLPHDEIGQLGAAVRAMSLRQHAEERARLSELAFARLAGTVQDPDRILSSLQEALLAAIPEGEWLVVPLSAIEDGAVPAAAGVSARQLAILVADPGPDGRSPTRPQLVAIAAEGDSVERVAIVLRDRQAVHGVVIGRRRIEDESARRHVELLCRAAQSALQTAELLRLLVGNEKLAVLGRLAAGVAHEMNNPLTFVLANLRVLEEQLTGDALDAARDAREGAERLQRIVRDVSSLGRSNTELTFEEVDLSEVARFAAKVAQSRLTKGNQVQVDVDAPEPVLMSADRGRLEQILVNLAVNAVQATESRSASDPPPQVSIRLRREGATAVVEVRDNGPGIPMSVQRRLFNAFVTTKGKGGTGLGLFLSRSFALAHRGDLALASTGPEGTIFRLALPSGIRKSSAPPAPRPSHEPRAVRPNVLIVDNEEAIVRSLERWLVNRAQVTGTTDVPRALEMAAGGSFSLVLCDLDMPQMSGDQFVEALRLRNPDAADRVVIMTGSASPGRFPAGVRVIPKPVDPDTLAELLGGGQPRART